MAERKTAYGRKAKPPPSHGGKQGHKPDNRAKKATADKKVVKRG